MMKELCYMQVMLVVNLDVNRFLFLMEIWKMPVKFVPAVMLGELKFAGMNGSIVVGKHYCSML